MDVILHMSESITVALITTSSDCLADYMLAGLAGYNDWRDDYNDDVT
jgi:hypothetical protein